MANKTRKNSKKKYIKKIAIFLQFIAFKILPWLVLSFFLWLLVSGIRYAMYDDPHLQVRSVEIQPPLALTSHQRHWLESQCLGKNILRINLFRLSRELESDPEIKSTKVYRRFPASIRLEVEKRHPVGLVHFSDKGKYGVVAKDGMIIQVLQEPVKGMIVFEALFLDSKNLRVGYRIQHAGFHQSVNFLSKYVTSEASRVYVLQKISCDKSGNVTIYYPNAPEIRLGRNPSDKIPAIEKIVHLLSDQESSKIAYIDLQYENVIVRKKGT